MSGRAFRSVTAKQAKDKVYRITGLRVTAAPTASAFSSGVSSSMAYIAIAAPTKGAVIPMTTTFGDFKRTDNQLMVNAHQGSDVVDFSFSPFNDYVLATASADTVNVFKLPEVMTKNFSTPNVSLTGLNSVLAIKWHPTVRGLIAIACKDSIVVAFMDFDGFEGDYVESPETISGRPIFKCAVEGFGNDVCTLSWSADGSKLVAITKGGALFIVDPRSHPYDQPLSLISLDDMKTPMFVEFTGSSAQNTEQVLVVGLGRARKPVYKFLDINSFAVTSSGDVPVSPGQLCGAYDNETGLLAVLSRGGQSLSMFDVSAVREANGKLTQTFFGLTQIILSSNSKGIAFAPKKDLSVLDMEVGRLLSHNGEGIESYSLHVIRKERMFYPELFPLTCAGVPTNSFDDWVDGKNTPPALMSLEPGTPNTPVVIHESAESRDASVAGVTSSFSGLSVDIPVTPTVSQVLASAESTYNSSARKMLDNKLQRTIYQHTTGVEPGHNKETFTYQLRPGPLLPLGRSLIANDKFWAIPWSASGSYTVYVRHATTVGRVPDKITGIRGTCHSLQSLDISTVEQNKIATVGDDGIVKVFKLPTEDVWQVGKELPSDLHTADWEFPILPPGEGRTGLIKFSPYVEGVLFAVAYNPASGQDEVNLLCVKDGSEGDNLSQTYNGLLNDRVSDLDFSPDGSTIAVSGRDNSVTLVSMPSGRIVNAFYPPQRSKELQVRFVDKDHILTIGYTRGSDRSISLIRFADVPAGTVGAPSTATVLKTVTVHNTAPMVPYYDIAAGLLVIANLGASSYNLFRVNVMEQPFIDPLSVFGSKSDILGSAFIHKSFVNVGEVEVLRSIKYSKSGEIWPVSWRVPRKRKEFFQDDLYESGCPKFASLTSADKYFSGSFEREVVAGTAKTLEFVSLQPEGMIKLSEAPEEKLTERQMKYHQMKQQATEEESKVNFLGHRTTEESVEYFREKAARMPVSSGRFDAKANEEHNDVSDSEWD